MNALRAVARVRIYVPCEVFTVRVTRGPSEIPTDLEQLVLKALGLGANTIEQLEQLFALGYRPMLRLVLDLLNRSCVTFNFATGEVRLTPHVEKQVKEGLLNQLEGFERTEDRIQLMRDLIAGTILPIRGAPSTANGYRIPAMLEASSAANVRSEDVLRVIRGFMRRHRTTRAGRPLQVLQVAYDLSLGGSPTSGQRRDLEIEVSAEYDEASDFLRLGVESPDDLPWRTRVALERKLVELANADEPHFVFKNIRDSAARAVEPTTTRSIHSQLAELDSLMARMTAAAPGTYETWQHNLERVALAIEGALAVQGVDQLRCTILTDCRRQTEVVKEIIRAAQRQVVIACPFVRYDATWQFREEIEAALAGGRSVFLLLGIGDEVDLDAGVGAWLYDLKARHHERLFFSRKSARCHAKFVVADGADLLLTSYNFFDRLPDSILEVGIRLAPENNEEARHDRGLRRLTFRIALELLSAAKGIFPDYIDAQLIDDSPAPMRTATGTMLQDLVVPSWSTRDVVDKGAYAEARTALWKRQWQSHLQQVKQCFAQLGTTYTLVRDAEHRRLLYEALRGAQNRLVVVSDQLSTRVVDRLFLEALQLCLARGVWVLLLYRRPESAAVAALAKVHAVHPHSFLHATADVSHAGLASHAKLLVSDDWCVITSFNFLSFSSDYEGAERYRKPTELGVMMHGTETQRFVDLLAKSVSMLNEPHLRIVPAAAQLAPAATYQPQKQPIRNLTELFDLLDDNAASAPGGIGAVKPELRVGQVISTWFANARDADSAFLELEELDAICSPFLGQAIAACLNLHSNGVPHARERWWLRLLEHVWWEKRDAYGIVLLLASAPPLNASTVPPIAVAVLAAHCSAGVATVEDFEDAVLRSSDEISAIAIATLAIPAVLYANEPPLQALQLLVDQLRDGTKAWAMQVIKFRTEHPEGVLESTVAAMVAEQLPHVTTEDSRLALEIELRRCVALPLDFKLGKLVWGHLVNRPLGLQRLLQATELQDIATIRAFLHEHSKKAGEDLLDEAANYIARTVNVRDRSIIADRRRLCVDHLNKVIRYAKAWSAAVAQAASASKQIISTDLIKLAESMSKELQALTEQAAALELQHQYPLPLLTDLLSRMNPLLQLAK